MNEKQADGSVVRSAKEGRDFRATRVGRLVRSLRSSLGLPCWWTCVMLCCGCVATVLLLLLSQVRGCWPASSRHHHQQHKHPAERPNTQYPSPTTLLPHRFVDPCMRGGGSGHHNLNRRSSRVGVVVGI